MPSPDHPPTRAPVAPRAAGPRPRSIVVVNTGDGKGKSSAAFGVMVRGWARGWRVGVVQCIKSGDWRTGEQQLAEELGIDWLALGDGFTWDSDDLEATAEAGRQAWGAAAGWLASGDYDLLVLDELTYLMSFGWVPVDDVVEAIRRRPERTNVVITGRDAPAALIEVADTVTEMRKVKHAYDQGVTARRGIEY